jgi:hypothetical protein
MNKYQKLVVCLMKNMDNDYPFFKELISFRKRRIYTKQNISRVIKELKNDK